MKPTHGGSLNLWLNASSWYLIINITEGSFISGQHIGVTNNFNPSSQTKGYSMQTQFSII